MNNATAFTHGNTTLPSQDCCTQLFDPMPDPVAIFAPDLTLHYTNPAFSRLASDGSHHTTLRHALGNFADIYEGPVCSALKTGKTITEIHNIPAKRGRHTLTGRYTPIYTEDLRTPLGVIFVASHLPNGCIPRNQTLETEQIWQHALEKPSSNSTSGYAVFDIDQQLTFFGHGFRDLIPEDRRIILEARSGLTEVLMALINHADDMHGQSAASSILRHLHRREGKPGDFQTSSRTTLQLSLETLDDEHTILRAKDVTHTRLLQTYVERQAELLKILSEAQSLFIGGQDQKTAFLNFLHGLTRIAGCHSAVIAKLRGNAMDDCGQILPLAMCGDWQHMANKDLLEEIRTALRNNTPYSAELGNDLGQPIMGAENTLILPIFAHETPVGVLALSGRPVPFDDAFIESLTPLISTLTAMIMASKKTRHQTQTANELRIYQKRVRAILGSINEGVITTDDKGRILDLNTAAERMFGIRLRDALARPLSLLSPHSSSSPFHDPGAFAQDDAQPFARQDTMCLRQNGRIFPAKFAINKITSDDETHYIIVVNDISSTVKDHPTPKKR